MGTVIVWTGFVVLILVLLAFDLGVFNRAHHEIPTGEALKRALGFFVLSTMFAGFVYLAYEHHWFGLGPVVRDGNGGEASAIDKLMPKTGAEAAIKYFTAYLIELSLSMDNLFVIALIMTYFNISSKNQHRVLYWGIMGALVMRGVMIGLGAAIIHSFHWVIYVFGLLLLYTAFKMLMADESEMDFEKNKLVRFAKRYFPIDLEHQGDRFFTRLDGRWAMTTMFLAVLVIETTDLLFAVDSIPAVFGITADPFIVFTSNVFAILGLRSLYFALADLLHRFKYLKFSLVVVLAFVGLKMLLHTLFPIDPLVSLGLVGLILTAGVAASFLFPEHKIDPAKIVPGGELLEPPPAEENAKIE